MFYPYLSYTKITLRLLYQKIRVLTTGLEADLIVDTHPLLFHPWELVWSAGGRQGLRPF